MVYKIQLLAYQIWYLLVRYITQFHNKNKDTNKWNKKKNSCFNAFSRVDVRVEVKIPGGVESYYVDVRGER
jgi:hypothetical protein